jgi:hypothetical protein
MRIFTIKRSDDGSIAWEGFKGVSLVVALPTHPSVGLPTVWISWEKFVEDVANWDGLHLAWTDLEVPVASFHD